MDLSDSNVTSNNVANQQFELLGRMAIASTAREIAALLVRWTQAHPGCRSATVVWGLDDTSNPQSEPVSPLGHQDLALARSAAMQASPMFSADGHRLAIGLLPTHPTVLLMTIDARAEGECFIDETSTMLQLAGCHLDRVLELAELKTSVQHLERSERVQRALFAISDLAGSDRDMPEVLLGIHAIVDTLMYAENFFIVLHDAERDTMRFLYFVDTEDKEPDDPDLEIPMRSRQRSLTWYLIRDAKPLMGNTEQLRSQVSGPLTIFGPDSQDWLGVPMLRDGRAH
ncbi:MAG TPA: bifunctional diguanylate cyclase/phosphodiesterase, partial [Xanthomonadaceae bacterium]|nr:bifunctional diguanylate cyclase/phosphodiesterase [Xanthomonadaceae bacterium]